jgi:anion-transporting  ArsA/GET3 family ATPase
VIAVCTAEEMPVNETLWLRDALGQDDLELDAVIVNARYPERFTAAEQRRLQRALARCASPPAAAALGAALSELARVSVQREQLQRLRDGLGADVLELPYLFAEQIGPSELVLLADALESELERRLTAPGAAAG